MKLKRALKVFSAMVLLLSFVLLLGCNDKSDKGEGEYYSFTDSLKREIVFEKEPERVVCLLGSYAEIALNAGLKVVGVTLDAVEERNLKLDETVEIVGTVKEPNIEKVIFLEPDFVILSTDIPSHVSLSPTLTKLGINHCYFKEESFNEYLGILKILTDLSKNKEAYEAFGKNVQAEIDSALTNLPDKKRIILYRAYSSGQKAKNKDTVAGKILFDLNCDNIADIYPSVLDVLSDEAVIDFNPEFIFIVPMGAGGEQSAAAAVNAILNKAAFSGVLAVKEKKVIALSKEMFHYKPNHRWGESYSYAKKILSE